MRGGGSKYNNPMPVRISKNRVALENIPLNESKGADIASAGTVNLDSATGNLVHLTGTTTVSAITLASGSERTVVFDGILTLTHNATTLILPGNANITTATGDRAIFRGDGSGNTRCISYTKADGTGVVTTAALGVVGSFTRDISLVSGTQVVSGLSITPKFFVFFATISNQAGATSMGLSSVTTDVSVRDNHNVAANAWGAVNAASISISLGGGNEYDGQVSAVASGEFTITWTKTGAPTGTLNIQYLAFT